MRLARLRHRVLIAMGLPACWTQSAAPTKTTHQADPPVVYEPPRHDVEIAMFDPKSCRLDAIVETVCGRETGEYCDPTARRLEISNNAEGLYVTSVAQATAAGKDFILDDHASEAFVLRVQALGDKLEGKPACCYSRCTPLDVSTAKPAPVPPNMMRTEACIPKPPAGTAVPDPNNPECPTGVQMQGEIRAYNSTRNDQCCYLTYQRRVIIRGRPARVDGDPRFADVGRGTAWHASLALATTRDAARAAHWLEAARMEHASIAAFAATSLRLLALGAPPELIARAHRAALEEIEHARAAFAIASAYAGEPLTPLAFADAPRTGTTTLRELAIETFVDGCLGETAAALEAEHDADAERDPEIASVLRRIADDETRHAELAWAIVAWCVRREPPILAELRAIACDDPALMREVVTPCLEALA